MLSFGWITNCLTALLCTVCGVCCLQSNCSVSISLVENMWSEYGPLGMLVENKKLSSLGGNEPAQDIYMPYVVNDITTFFTLLVGIYFPSVTGETDKSNWCTHIDYNVGFILWAYVWLLWSKLLSIEPYFISKYFFTFDFLFQVSWLVQTGQATWGMPRSPSPLGPSWLLLPPPSSVSLNLLCDTDTSKSSEMARTVI